MSRTPDSGKLDRRRFIKATAAGVGAAAVVGAIAQSAEEKAPADAPAAKVDEKVLVRRTEVPGMEYARLGRTNWMVSRIVAGWCRDLSLHRRLLQRGVNYYDCARGYGNYEVELKDFLKSFRDKVFIVSKATDVAGYEKIDDDVVTIYRKAMKDFLGDGEGDLLALHKKAVEKQKASGEKPDLRSAGRRMAALYSQKLDESLSRLGIDHVDAYFVHGVAIPWLFDCLEVWEAYEKAHKAGKVKHFAFSCHANHKEVLAAAGAANDRGPWKIDLIMPGVNPESFDKLKPELQALKKQDVGIVAMKTKGIANRPVDGREEKFKSLMGDRKYNEWERAKLWMLNLAEGYVDNVIAAIKNVDEMDRTLGLATVKLSAEAKRELRALVKYEMAGACHLCGDCQSACPEHIALTDMIRYHAYVHQYDERQYARELYAKAGYDPARLCTGCGKCADACTSGVEITRIIRELSVCMA